jgi:PAS domain S-box-containing protein
MSGTKIDLHQEISDFKDEYFFRRDGKQNFHHSMNHRSLIKNTVEDTVRFFQQTIEASSDAIVAINKEDCIVFYNAGAETIFSWRANEIIGRHISKLMPVEYYGNIFKNFDEIMRKSVVIPREIVGIRRDGEEFPAEVTVSRFSDAGDVIQVAILRDISIRREAEIEGKKSNRLYKLLRRTAMAANEAMDSDQAIEKCMKILCKSEDWSAGILFEKPADSLAEFILSDIKYLSSSKVVSGVLTQNVENLSNYSNSLITQVLTTNSIVGHKNLPGGVSFSGAHGALALPIFVQNEIVSILVFFSAEAIDFDESFLQVLKSIASQIARVIERKNAEDELRLAKLEADSANRAKSDFLSSMSHELRTPMNAILGFSEFLLNDPRNPLNETQTDYLTNVFNAGNHLLSLMNDVLELARVEAGKVDLSPENLSANHAVRESIDLISTFANEKNIEIIDKTVQKAELVLFADATRLHQVFINILSNAIKYNKPNGKIIIDIEEEGKTHAKIILFNSGNGIAEVYQDSVFEPFERLDQENGDIPGTGIGLTVTRRFVELMGGKIGFDNKPGVGVSFWFTVPLFDAEVGSGHVSSTTTSTFTVNDMAVS